MSSADGPVLQRRMLQRRQRRRAQGFSFIEILIVIVIIGLLAGAVSLSTRHYLDKAKQTRARSDLATYRSALESYYAEFGGYPTNEQGLAVLAPRFIDRLRNDPWSRAYQYNAPGRNGPYEVTCLGADGREGGDGVAADIASDDLDAAPTSTAEKR
jgi:general secretion pathway protein G